MTAWPTIRSFDRRNNPSSCGQIETLCYNGHHVDVTVNSYGYGFARVLDDCPGTDCPSAAGEELWINDIGPVTQAQLGFTYPMPLGCDILEPHHAKEPAGWRYRYGNTGKAPVSVITQGWLLWPGRGLARITPWSDHPGDQQPKQLWHENVDGRIQTTVLGEPDSLQAKLKLRWRRSHQPIQPSIPIELATALEEIEDLRAENQQQEPTPEITATLRRTQQLYFQYVQELEQRLRTDRVRQRHDQEAATADAANATATTTQRLLDDLEANLEAERFRRDFNSP